MSENARLSENDDLVADISCGFGNVAILCVTDFHCPSVIGLNSRVDFFREAYRTLKPGGILSMVDMVYNQPRNALEKIILPHLQDGFYIPSAKIYSFADYIFKVHEAGFEIIELKILLKM